MLHGAPPSGGRAELVTAEDGVTLRAAFWPADGARRGSVLMCQGRSEYIEKSYEWIAWLQTRGFAVCAFDWRGQGLSARLLAERNRGHVEDFAELQRDIDAAAAAFREETGPGPMLLLGHSMGGLAAIRYLLRKPGAAAGAITTAPMLGVRLPPGLAGLAGFLAHTIPALGWGERYMLGCSARTSADYRFEGNVLTRDRERFEAHIALLKETPCLQLGGVTWAWMRAALRETASVCAQPTGALRDPLLILRAEDDAVVSNDAIAEFAGRQAPVELVKLQGSRHEPLMEIEDIQAQVRGAIDSFLNRVVPM